MQPPHPEWKAELDRLRAERDTAYRQMAALQKSIDQLTDMMAGQNDRLDQVVSMLRRREAQLKRSESEVRKLRRKLGLDDDPGQPVFHATPAPTTAEVQAIVDTVRKRVERLLRKRGVLDDDTERDDSEDAQLAMQEASLGGRVAMGLRAGKRPRVLAREPWSRLRGCAGNPGQLESVQPSAPDSYLL